MMTAAQLRRSIDELSQSGFNFMPQAVELQRKLAFPFVTFVMTLLAVPFGVTTGRRGALYGIGLGIVIALSYWFVMSVFIAIGKDRTAPPCPRRLDAEHHRLRLRDLPRPHDEDIAAQLSALSSQLSALSSSFRLPAPVPALRSRLLRLRRGSPSDQSPVPRPDPSPEPRTPSLEPRSPEPRR